MSRSEQPPSDSSASCSGKKRCGNAEASLEYRHSGPVWITAVNFAAAPIDGSLKELPDTHLPRELDGRGRIELSGI